MEFVQYTNPNAEALSEQINKVKGDRSMATFADDIRRSSPSVKVSAPTISRACNWSGGNPVSIELLEAIALIADKDTGVTKETLLAANGMRSKHEDSLLSQRETLASRRESLIDADRKIAMIIQNEIMCRGYALRKLDRVYNGYSLQGYIGQRDRFFPRNYNFGFSVSGMSPCNTWKFGVCQIRLSEDSSEDVIEAHVGNFINKIASVLASDSIESELYEREKYSLVFVDRKIYNAFMKRIYSRQMMVNGLMTAILVDLVSFNVVEERQLKRYDGAEASSLFKTAILEENVNMELFEISDLIT